MTLPLHTGVRTCTVSAQWSVWDIPGRLVVTDPWALRHARQVLQEQLTAVDRVVRPSGRRGRRAGDGVGAGVFGDRPHPVAAVRPFPYGLTLVPPGEAVHRPAPGARPTDAGPGWPGLPLEPGPAVRAWAAQLCAERVAEETSCGVLVALGGDIATSGLAPAGGWRLELDRGASLVVALDGGAVSRVGTVGTVPPGVPHHRRGRHGIGGPATGRTGGRAWRSVTVVAADAPSASACCTGALLRGAGAPSWLAGLEVPARLVDARGTVQAVGGWPVPPA